DVAEEGAFDVVEGAEEVAADEAPKKKSRKKKDINLAGLAVAPMLLSAAGTVGALQILTTVLGVIAVVMAIAVLVTAIIKRKKFADEDAKAAAAAQAEQHPEEQPAEEEPVAQPEVEAEVVPEPEVIPEPEAEVEAEPAVEEPVSEEEPEEDDDEEVPVATVIEDDEQEYLVSEEEGMKVVLEKCYMARLIQTYDHTKGYYSELKNELLSYKKVSARISKKRESFRLGKNIVAKFAVKGKTLCMYLPLNPLEYAESKYKVEDVSDTASLADTPMLYRIKNGRRLRYAKELLAIVLTMLGADKKRTYESVDYTADIAFRTTGTLIGDGLITRKLVKASEALFGKSLDELPEQEAQEILAEAAEREEAKTAAQVNAEAEVAADIAADTDTQEQPAEVADLGSEDGEVAGEPTEATDEVAADETTAQESASEEVAADEAPKKKRRKKADN
ncbi:MAG: hypothetical protein K2M44_04610, partial [Clostridia bacterium]|nr:hypothetical protein [Clostridia bacterium]